MYLLFSGQYYENHGGLSDCKGVFKSVQEAKDGFDVAIDEWGEILNVEAMKYIDKHEEDDWASEWKPVNDSKP